jgi:hypothetical protein
LQKNLHVLKIKGHRIGLEEIVADHAREVKPKAFFDTSQQSSVNGGAAARSFALARRSRFAIEEFSSGTVGADPIAITSSYKPFSSSFRIACIKTLAPFAISEAVVNSFGEWLIPPTLGTKIIPIGTIRARF